MSHFLIKLIKVDALTASTFMFKKLKHIKTNIIFFNRHNRVTAIKLCI
jgi:hypothetical protein